jgi:hypothetical protein
MKGNTMYRVLDKANGELLVERETISRCHEEIRMLDRDMWKDFVVVDEDGNPVEWQIKA